MKAYLASHFFNEAGFAHTEALAAKIRENFPNLDLYVPQQNMEINDKSKVGITAIDIAKGDNAHLDESDILIAVLDGVEIDSGVSCEIGYFSALCMDSDSIILGLYTDMRRDGDGDNHYYINLYTKGMVELYGKVVNSTDELIDAIADYMK
jgi:hypothetical protein